MIEVGPGGIFAIGKPVGDIIAPTKHDGLPRMAQYNPTKNGESSRERSARIHELLKSGAPFGPADFEPFSAYRARTSSGGEARRHHGKRPPPSPPGPTCQDAVSPGAAITCVPGEALVALALRTSKAGDLAFPVPKAYPGLVEPFVP